METLNKILVILVSLSSLAAADTLYETLRKDSDHSEFFKMVSKDEVLKIILDRREVTIFAPTNEAIHRASRKRNLREEDKQASYYFLNLLATKNIFPAAVSPYFAGVAPLFLSMKDVEKGQKKEYFVNNAKIIGQQEKRGLEGGMQLLYVIDELLVPYKPITNLPPTALDILKQPSIYDLKEPLDAFSSRVASDKDKDIFNKVGNHTFFLPIGTVNPQNMHKLRGIDTWVIKSHVIFKHVLFTRTMSRKSYKSETYTDSMKVELKLANASPDNNEDEYYIESNTIQRDEHHKRGVVRSKIVKANIPVSNGVVHLISHPLMIIDKTLWDIIEGERDGQLGQFYKLVSNNPTFTNRLKSSDERTVFAPTNRAFAALGGDKFQNMLNNATVSHSLLELHMVMAAVSTQDVWNTNITSMLTSDLETKLYFRVVGEERNKTLTVEAGGVNATAVMSDIGATNGILHVIDRVLGVPYLTVYNKLKHDPDLHTTFKLSEQDEWNLKLNDKEKSYTFFVPNRKAWEELRNEMPSEHKQLNMGQFSYYVHKILDRHLVVGMELSKENLERLENQDKIQMVHGTFKISARKQGTLIVEWEGVQANIVRPDVQATNGVIHVIDKVMMKRRDLTKSGSSSFTSATSLVLSILFLTLEVLMFRQ